MKSRLIRQLLKAAPNSSPEEIEKAFKSIHQQRFNKAVEIMRTKNVEDSTLVSTMGELQKSSQVLKSEPLPTAEHKK